jgi:O-antigen/teichoic acid export membrane protein
MLFRRVYCGPLLTGLADQAVASLTFLALHGVAARVLPPPAFGLFVLMVSAAMVGLAVMTALVLDPVSVRAGGRGAYPAVAAGLLAVVSALLVAGAAVAAALSEGGGVVSALALGLAVSPGLGLLWLARRLAYLQRRPGAALRLSVLWGIGCAAAVAVLRLTGAISPGALAGAVFAVAAVVGGGAVAAAARRWRVRRLLWRAATAHHLRFGGWLAAGLPFGIVAAHGPLWVLAALAGAEAAGPFRLLLLLAMPLVQLAAAVGTVLQPRLVTLRARRGGGVLRARTWAVGLALALPALPWAAVLAAWPDVVPWLFGPAQAVAAGLAPLAVAGVAVKALAAGPTLAVRAERDGPAVFLGTVAGGLTTVGTAWLLVPVFAVGGAVAAVGIGAAANLGVLAAALHPPRWRWRLRRAAAAS